MSSDSSVSSVRTGLAVPGGRRRGEDVQPAGGYDADAERHVAGVDQVNSHGFNGRRTRRRKAYGATAATLRGRCRIPDDTPVRVPCGPCRIARPPGFASDGGQLHCTRSPTSGEFKTVHPATRRRARPRCRWAQQPRDGRKGAVGAAGDTCYRRGYGCCPFARARRGCWPERPPGGSRRGLGARPPLRTEHTRPTRRHLPLERRSRPGRRVRAGPRPPAGEGADRGGLRGPRGRQGATGGRVQRGGRWPARPPLAGAAPWTQDVAPDVITNIVPRTGRLVVILMDRTIATPVTSRRRGRRRRHRRSARPRRPRRGDLHGARRAAELHRPTAGSCVRRSSGRSLALADPTAAIRGQCRAACARSRRLPTSRTRSRTCHSAARCWCSSAAASR